MLDEELEAWAAVGCIATLWWRDDDACKQTPELARLADTAGQACAPLVLAAIPERADESLAATLTRPGIAVWQHGVRHVNRAQPGERKSEFPETLPADRALREIASARERFDVLLDEAGVPRSVPVFVPPWNRIADKLAVELAAEYAAVSAFGKRRLPGVRWVNTHIDIIDWRGDRGFIGARAATRAIAEHLRTRRLDPDLRCVGTGLLTHHLDHDEDAWRFLSDLGHWISRCPQCRWLSSAELLAA